MYEEIYLQTQGCFRAFSKVIRSLTSIVISPMIRARGQQSFQINNQYTKHLDSTDSRDRNWAICYCQTCIFGTRDCKLWVHPKVCSRPRAQIRQHRTTMRQQEGRDTEILFVLPISLSTKKMHQDLWSDIGRTSAYIGQQPNLAGVLK